MACQGLVAEGRKAVNANQISNAKKMTSATITTTANTVARLLNRRFFMGAARVAPPCSIFSLTDG